MKPSSIVVAGLSSGLVAISVLACAVSADPGDSTENVGEAREAICKDPPCGPVKPDPTPKPPPPPPPTSEAFQCSGSAGKDPNTGRWMSWTVDCAGWGGQPYGTCLCLETEEPSYCIAPTDGGHCNGFSVISTYTCPTLFPYLRCNAYGSCTCNMYPN